MFSSDEEGVALHADDSLEGGAPIELPSDPLPEEEPPKKKKKKDHRTGSGVRGLVGFTGQPKVLTFAERVDAWHKHVQGIDIFELAVEYKTTPEKVQEGLDNVALELGYPHNHIDPELERFKVVSSNYQLRAAIFKAIQYSNKVLNQIIGAANRLTANDTKSLEQLEPDELRSYNSLMEARQLETKTVTTLMDKLLAVNAQIAQVTGINKTKPVRKPKAILKPEDALEALGDAELLELIAADNESVS